MRLYFYSWQFRAPHSKKSTQAGELFREGFGAIELEEVKSPEDVQAAFEKIKALEINKNIILGNPKGRFVFIAFNKL